jgi:neutral ceramidase
MNSWNKYWLALLLLCGSTLNGSVRAADSSALITSASTNQKQVWKGELLAGTAKITLTPENPQKPVHDGVNARVLVLQIAGKRVAFASVDLGVFTSERLVDACKEKFGLSQILLSSSHTHSDPGSKYQEFYEKQIMDAVGMAVQNMFPARIGAGHLGFPQLGFNRLVIREDGHARESWVSDDHYLCENPDRIPFGPVDPEVGIIKVEDAEGQPRAVIMNYACHADVVCQNYAVRGHQTHKNNQSKPGERNHSEVSERFAEIRRAF